MLCGLNKFFEKDAEKGVIPNNFNNLKENDEFKNTFSFYVSSTEESHKQNVTYFLYLEDILLEIKNYLKKIK